MKVVYKVILLFSSRWLSSIVLPLVKISFGANIISSSSSIPTHHPISLDVSSMVNFRGGVISDWNTITFKICLV